MKPVANETKQPICLDALVDSAPHRDITELNAHHDQDASPILLKAANHPHTVFLIADADSLACELCGALEDSDGGDMWKGRAMSFICAVTPVLTDMRDRGYLHLTPTSYMQYMELASLEEIVFEHNGRLGEGFDQQCTALKNYIESLPDYDKSPSRCQNQSQKTQEQHGFIAMQVARSIGNLVDRYEASKAANY